MRKLNFGNAENLKYSFIYYLESLIDYICIFGTNYICIIVMCSMCFFSSDVTFVTPPKTQRILFKCLQRLCTQHDDWTDSDM